MKHKVGDKVVVTSNYISSYGFDLGDVVTIMEVANNGFDYFAARRKGCGWFINEDECEAYQETSITQDATGGPSPYYDMPYATWVTTNDQMEYLAEHKWGKYAIHLKDIFKGLCRWGDKQGTTPSYDARKIIYYGLRVLMMLEGKASMQQYLSDLKNDPQFKEDK